MARRTRGRPLPVGYFHVVFSLPAEAAAVALQNKAAIYDLLFRAAAETMMTIAADPRHLGARIGITAVLPVADPPGAGIAATALVGLAGLFSVLGTMLLPGAATSTPVRLRRAFDGLGLGVSLGFAAINQAEEVWLLVAGEGKAAAVADALAADADPVQLPAAGVHGVRATRWLLDQAAAGKLPAPPG